MFGEERFHGILRLVLVAEHLLHLQQEAGFHVGRDRFPRGDGERLEVVFVGELELAQLDARRHFRAQLPDALLDSLVYVRLRFHGFEGKEERRQIAFQERGDELRRGVPEHRRRVLRFAAAHRGHERALEIGRLHFTKQIDPRQELVREPGGFGEDDLGTHEGFEDALHHLRLGQRLPLADEALQFRSLLHDRKREQRRGPIAAAEFFPQVVQAVVGGESLHILGQACRETIGGAQRGHLGG